VSEDKTKELQGVERPAAIQHPLEILPRGAREIRAALTRLSDRDPSAVPSHLALDHRRPILAPGQIPHPEWS